MATDEPCTFEDIPTTVVQHIVSRLPLVTGASLALASRGCRDAVDGAHKERLDGIYNAVLEYLQTKAFHTVPMTLTMHVGCTADRTHATLLVVNGATRVSGADSITFIHGQDGPQPPRYRIEYAYNTNDQRESFLYRGIKAMLRFVEECSVENRLTDLTVGVEAQRMINAELAPILLRMRRGLNATGN
jgi:hypothetical protein